MMKKISNGIFNKDHVDDVGGDLDFSTIHNYTNINSISVIVV